MPNEAERKGPHHFSEPELRSVGVRILERHSTSLLECEVCGCVWSPDLQTGGVLPRGYWECPEGRCNVVQE